MGANGDQVDAESRKRPIIAFLIALLLLAAAGEAVLILQLKDETGQLRDQISASNDELVELGERLSAPQASAPDDDGTFVPGVDKADVHQKRAVEAVEETLAQLAQAQQRYYEKHGEWLMSSTGLASLGKFNIPVNVEIQGISADATAFCIQAGYTNVPDTHRRYISVTSEIDEGTCQPGPLTDQVGSHPAAQSGGEMEFTDVALRDDGIPPDYPHLGRKWTIVFDARWTGPGYPEKQSCTWRINDQDGDLLEWGEYGFSVIERTLDDHEGPALFERDLGGRPSELEWTCRNSF
jgi:hypothetical protein